VPIEQAGQLGEVQAKCGKISALASRPEGDECEWKRDDYFKSSNLYSLGRARRRKGLN